MQLVPVESQLTEYLHNKAAALRIPLTGSFELTPVCNMACRMCYVRMTREQQESIRPLHSAEEWIELGRTAKERGLVYLLLTGGEPFLRRDFRTIMEGLHKLGLVISINSNGTLIDEDTVAWLKKCPPARVNITLYGASDDTYARLCNNPKGFTQAVRGIRLLREAGIVVKINCSLTPYNVCDLEKIVEFCRENKLHISPTSYMFPPLRRDNTMIGRNDRFTPEEAAFYLAKCEQLLYGDERFLSMINEPGFLTMPLDHTDECMDTEGIGMRCRAGKCSFWVTWDGRMSPCGMIPESYAMNAFEQGFDAAWKNTMDTAAAVRLPAKCGECPAFERCRPCAAMVYSENGSYEKVPEYRCRMAEAYPAACRRIESEILEKIGSKDKQE